MTDAGYKEGKSSLRARRICGAQCVLYAGRVTKTNLVLCEELSCSIYVCRRCVFQVRCCDRRLCGRHVYSCATCRRFVCGACQTGDERKRLCERCAPEKTKVLLSGTVFPIEV